MTPESLHTSLAAKHWEKIGIRHHHGINIPLFSLHSETSCGIGEFPDLLPLIDWCALRGLDVIQLLPLNDTGVGESPYNAISSCALNPIHLGLAHLPHLEEFPRLIDKLAPIQALTQKKRIDYARVRKKKYAWLQQYVKAIQKYIEHSLTFRDFIEIHSWLPGYALFCCLKRLHEGKPWEKWKAPYKHPNDQQFEALFKIFEEEMHYHMVVQFLCYRQFEEVKARADAKKVFLKGDIPILISRDSTSVWRHRYAFHLEESAGVPPDQFSPYGQNWGFPIYNWRAQEKTGFSWWKQRLKAASRLYHIYRIDHAIGFFRIWSIPKRRKTAKSGRYLPKDSRAWDKWGIKLLTMLLESSEMLPIAEDLGRPPPRARKILLELGICLTKILRWEREWRGSKPYIDPSCYPAASMSSISTHDCELLTAWWQNNPKEWRGWCKMSGWNPKLPFGDDQIRAFLYESHHSNSLFHINLLHETFALFPELNWGNPEEERINMPGVISNLNWTYRYRPSVEQIVAHRGLKKLYREIL